MSFLFKISCLFILSIFVCVSYGNQTDNCKGSFKPSKNVKKIQKQADQGSVRSAGELGIMYLYGNEVPQNLQKALHYLKKAEKASTQRPVRAVSNPSLPMARNTRYLRGLTEESNDAEFLYYGALLFLLGAEIIQSNGFAVALLERLASLGNGYPKAQYALGEMYRDGFYVQQDKQKSTFWFDQAKARGYTGEQSSSSDISEIKSILEYVNSL